MAKSADFLLIAHRGASKNGLENTLESFKESIALGADMIECDTCKTKDNQLIVMHDATIDRTANGSGLIKNLTLAKLQTYKMKDNEPIPTLKQAIITINRQVPLNIELKQEGLETELVILLHEFMDRGWSYDDFLISSFNHPQLQIIKKLDASFKVGMLMGSIPLDYAASAQVLGAYSIHSWQETINQQLIDDVHARGLKCFVFTVNNKEERALLKIMGVDGIFTDYL